VIVLPGRLFSPKDPHTVWTKERILSAAWDLSYVSVKKTKVHEGHKRTTLGTSCKHHAAADIFPTFSVSREI
jgi:hypothetical protein